MLVKARAVVVVAAIAGLIPVSQAVAANPSTDEIIATLRPAAPVTRGIRPTNPGADSPIAATPAPDTATPPVAAAPAWGVSPGLPVRPPAQTASVQPSPPPAAPPERPSVNLSVEFATGSAELTPAATQTLDSLGRALSSPALAGFRFRIEGHTDTVGTRAANQALSARRAARVVDYLASGWNVARDRMVSAGMGQDYPLVATGPNVPEPRNRRVTVVNLGA